MQLKGLVNREHIVAGDGRQVRHAAADDVSLTSLMPENSKGPEKVFATTISPIMLVHSLNACTSFAVLIVVVAYEHRFCCRTTRP